VVDDHDFAIGRHLTHVDSGPGRQLAVIRRPLEQLRQAGHAHGATVNDVLLTAVAGGLHELLVGRVSRSRAGAAGLGPCRCPGQGRDAGGSTPMVLPLPVGHLDPVSRPTRIAAVTRAAKAGRDRHYRGVLASPLLPTSLIWLARCRAALAFPGRRRLVRPPQRPHLGGRPRPAGAPAPPLDLYHTALVVGVPGAGLWPRTAGHPECRWSLARVLVEGPVGSRWMGRWRVFRHEVRCWPDSVIAWLLAQSGLATDTIHPPAGPGPGLAGRPGGGPPAVRRPP
jgi:hypothetical protein